MLRKLTQKQETFTQNLFKGMYQRDAYMDAYHPKYALATIDAHASRLAKNGKVLVRWAELQQKAEDDSVATVLERKQRLTEIIRARLTDYTTCGPDRDLIDVGPESPNTGALQEVTSRTEFDENGVGAAVITKLKLHNPIAAIDLQNKMEKLYGDGPTVNIDNRTLNIISELSDEQLAIIAAKALSDTSRSGDGASEEKKSP